MKKKCVFDEPCAMKITFMIASTVDDIIFKKC